MINGREVLALIPARRGSKGFPGKNVASLAGRRLIDWTIDSAQESSYVDRIVVTSDDPIVRDIAAERSLDFLQRPAHLCSDTATAHQVIVHALHGNATEELCTYLQPTTPLRTADDIDSSLELLVHSKADGVVSVSPVTEHPEWMFRLDEASGSLTSLLKGAIPLRRQDLAPTFRLNGAIYCAQTSTLLSTSDFFDLALTGYVMPSIRSTDIDTVEDLAEVERLVASTVGGSFC